MFSPNEVWNGLPASYEQLIEKAAALLEMEKSDAEQIKKMNMELIAAIESKG